MGDLSFATPKSETYFCAWCMKRSPFPLAHPTLGHVCPHCLRPFGPFTKPRRITGRLIGLPKPKTRPEPKAAKQKHARRRKRVGDRDRWICWLCGQPVDPTADGSDAHQPTVDHVLRIREGGKDGINNLRLAHKSCNMYREGANIEPFAPPIREDAG